MPSKNIIKTYIPGGYYHIYNRGVEKREIFLDEYDCSMFLYYLKVYLSPKDELKNFIPSKRLLRFTRNNLSEEIDLLSFALMPNHIHLELKQYTQDGIKKLMQRVCTAYVMFFNKKYHRVSSLFQNKYKGILLETDEYLLQLSHYIHHNPDLLSSNKINFQQFTSYPYYLGLKSASWVKQSEILSYFKSRKDTYGYHSYEDFFKGDEGNVPLLEDIVLEEEK